MPYVYKTQANISRSDIKVPDINYDFKTIVLPDFMTEKCLRVTPRGNCTKKGSRITTFNDVCQMTCLYLSGVKVTEISRIIDRDIPIVHLYIKRATFGVNRREMHKENRVRNMLGKDLAKVEDYLND